MTDGGEHAAGALDALPFALLIFDAHGTPVFANPAARAAIGPGAGASGPTMAEAAEAAARHAGLDPRQAGMLARALRAAGIARDPPDEDPGPTVIAFDAAASAGVQGQAAHRPAILQTMLDTMRHGIALYGPDRRLVAANRLACDLTGLLPAEMVPGQGMDELIARQRARGWLDAQAAAMLLAADRRRPSRGTRNVPDGRVIEAASSPTPDGGFVVTWTDVTARAMAERSAAEQAALLRATLDSIRHGIAMYGPGPDQRLLAANPLAGPAYGLPPLVERIGARFVDLVEEQLANGCFGQGPEARRIADAVRALDRRLSHRYVRHLPGGAVIEIVSHPTPDGGFTISHTDVTGLVRAEAAAAERATILQVTLDHMRHGITYFGPDRRVIAGNGLAEQMNDAPPGRVPIGLSLEELIAGQVASGTMGAEGERHARMALALDRRQPHRYVRPASRGRVIEVTSDPTPDGGFVVTHADITALANAEAEAAARAATLQVMLDHMRHGISYFGPDRRLRAVNRLDQALSGLPPDATRIGTRFETLVALQAARTVAGAEAPRIAAMALALDRTRPHRYVRPTDDGRVLEVTSDPTPDGGFVITRADVTALAEAEAEAKRRADLQQVMLDNIRHGLCLVDAAGKIVAANPVFRQIFGVTEAVARPGEPYFAFIEWLAAQGEYGEGAEAAAHVAMIRTTDRSRPFRKVRERPNGTVLEIVSDPTPDGGFVLTFSDVTAERRIRAELERAKEAAEAANRAKSRFLAAISHELRTPLNAVIGFSEALSARSLPVASTGEYGRAILEAGRHLLTLIDDILEATRAESLGMEVVEGETDLAALVESVTRLAAPAAEAAGLRIDAALPRRSLPRVRAEERRLRQVLQALLSNAMKFTPRGGRVTVAVAREPDAAGGGLALRVSDTGIGMRAEDIPRVFEPFTQIDGGTARRFPGTGLGLYLARAMAAAQGATLDLESVAGRGTVAVLRFPAARLLPVPRARRVRPRR